MTSTDSVRDMNTMTGALRVRACDGSPSLSFLFVDKAQDRAVFHGFGIFLPVYRIVAPLSLIAGIQVVKHEREKGKAKYGVAVRLHKGENIKFGCRSRDQAMNIMRKITKYLDLQHHH